MGYPLNLFLRDPGIAGYSFIYPLKAYLSINKIYACPRSCPVCLFLPSERPSSRSCDLLPSSPAPDLLLPSLELLVLISRSRLPLQSLCSRLSSSWSRSPAPLSHKSSQSTLFLSPCSMSCVSPVSSPGSLFPFSLIQTLVAAQIARGWTNLGYSGRSRGLFRANFCWYFS